MSSLVSHFYFNVYSSVTICLMFEGIFSLHLLLQECYVGHNGYKTAGLSFDSWSW